MTYSFIFKDDTETINGDAVGVRIINDVPSLEVAEYEMAKVLEGNLISSELVSLSDIPTDRTFRNAWEHDTSAAPEKVRTNMSKAKVLAHDMRRATRDKAFKPLDIQATIPDQAQAAEAARQIIRDKDAQKQIDIDSASDEPTLKLLINKGVKL